MKLIQGIITYNRLNYLKKCISTWNETRNRKYKWILLIADDGSKDGSLDFIKNLRITEVEIKYFLNERRGVHYQVNQLLKESSKRRFDLGFIAEDDVYFLSSGWDDLHLRAVEKSGFEFLCYFNGAWARNHGKSHHVKQDCLYNKKNQVQSKVIAYNSFGCFWTFTKNVIKKVGYFDLHNFGIWGNGHTDYALRCCRAGFNKSDSLFDAFGSENYIGIQDKNYRSSYLVIKGLDPQFIGITDRGIKGRTLEEKNRVYIAYNEIPFNMLGEKLG